MMDYVVSLRITKVKQLVAGEGNSDTHTIHPLETMHLGVTFLGSGLGYFWFGMLSVMQMAITAL